MKSRVHAIKWYELKPLAIHCMSYNNSTSQLAVSRSDQSIEIWSCTYTTFYLDRVIQGSPTRSIEALVWCRNRLFSVGLNGFLIEYDLVNLNEKSSLPTSFGGCWCMVANEKKSLLAIGTEDGYVSIYKVVSGDLVHYERSFENHPGRIVCLNFDPFGEYIVTGSINSLRVWDVKKGKSIREIKARSGPAEVVILCVAMTNDLEVISGDSLGIISFWNAEGLLILSIKSHKAEILCLDLIHDKNGFPQCFASGVDPVIVSFRRSHRDKWVKEVPQHVHTHDVRCLLHINGFLVSGGVDSYLTLTKVSPKFCLKFSPFSPTNYFHVAPIINCVLLQYPNNLELWLLGNTNEESDENYEPLFLTSNPVNLLNVKMRENEVIVSSAISCEGKWLAVSTTSSLKLYQLHLECLNSENPLVSITKLKFNIKDIQPAIVLKFISDTNRLVSLSHAGKLQVFQLNVQDSALLNEYEIEGNLSGCHLLSISDDGHLAAVSGHDGNTSVFNLNDCELLCTLPQLHCQLTTLEFVPNSHFLMMATQWRQVLEYDVDNQRFSKSFEKLSLKKESTFEDFEVPDHSIRGIVFIPGDMDSVLFYDETNVFYFSRKNNEQKISTKVGLKSSSMYKHLLQFVHLQNDYLVALQIPPLSHLKRLPPKLVTKQFGT